MLPRVPPWRSLAGASILVLAACASNPLPDGVGSASPATRYWVYVAAESADLLHRVRFGPEGAVIERSVNVGELPDETEGPHGLRISPDGRHLYMTTAHGLPSGKLWKIEIETDRPVAQPILLGRFPATLDITPDGLYAVVANFNLHGEHVPSTLSTVYLPDLVEVAQTIACTMPHGVRISPDGRAAYSACMMDDRVVEMDTRTLEITRHFDMTPGCSPTWAQPALDGEHVYVACNASDQVLEISLLDGRHTRSWSTGRGPYNLAATPDGMLLLMSLRPGAGVQAIDLGSGAITPAMPTSGPLAHGVVVSPDGRYAFVTVEDIGMTPGKVDVFALPTLARVASVDVGQQAGGIAFWKMEPLGP